MKEQAIQKKITTFLQKRGYIVIKIITSNWNGIPDLLVLIGNNKHFWIEVKKSDGVLSELQKFRIRSLEALGDLVLVPYGYDAFIKQFELQIQEGGILTRGEG